MMYIYNYMCDSDEVWTYIESSLTGPETLSPPNWK